MGLGSSRHTFADANCNGGGEQYANSNVHTNAF
jgi:hypothetical protein